MTHLVIGDDLALLRVEQSIALLEPRHHAFHGIGEIGHGHAPRAAAGRQQRRLVDEIGEVGASLLVGTINENLPSATSRARYYLPYPSRYFSGSRINRFAMPYSQRPG